MMLRRCRAAFTLRAALYAFCGAYFMQRAMRKRACRCACASDADAGCRLRLMPLLQLLADYTLR